MNEDQLKHEFYGNFHKFSVDNLISNLAQRQAAINQLSAKIAELEKKLAEKESPKPQS